MIPAYLISQRYRGRLACRIFAMLDSVAYFTRMAKLSASPDHTSDHDRIIHAHCVREAAVRRRQAVAVAREAGFDYADVQRRYAEQRNRTYTCNQQARV